MQGKLLKDSKIVNCCLLKSSMRSNKFFNLSSVIPDQFRLANVQCPCSYFLMFMFIFSFQLAISGKFSFDCAIFFCIVCLFLILYELYMYSSESGYINELPNEAKIALSLVKLVMDLSSSIWKLWLSQMNFTS